MKLENVNIEAEVRHYMSLLTGKEEDPLETVQYRVSNYLWGIIDELDEDKLDRAVRYWYYEIKNGRI